MTEQEIIFAQDVETGKAIGTTVKKLILNRALVEGDSGSGKSHKVTGLIEKTDKLAQRIIIDIEGEYFPLKDNFSFLLIGKQNDIIKPNVELNLNDIYVDKLAKKLIEKSADTIIDLSETPNQAPHFIAVFFPALLKYAKLLKRPLLVFLDEAHVFAPEKGTGSEESLKAVIEMAKRGRKRGIGLICATQAMADFSKNVVRQLKIRFIGNCTYDKDIKSACEYLGFGKDREDELKNLAEDHHFFVASTGNAITIDGQRPKKVLKIKALKNKTKLYDFDFGKNFKVNEKDAGAIKNIAAEFSDIPAEINQELTERERLKKENIDLQAKNKELTVRLIQLEKHQPQSPKIDPAALQKAEQSGYQKGFREAEKQFAKFQNDVHNAIRGYIPIVRRISILAKEFGKVNADDLIRQVQELINSKTDLKLPTLPTEAKLPPTPIVNTNSARSTNSLQIDSGLSGPGRRILTAIAQRKSQEATKQQIALITGYSIKSSGLDKALSILSSSSFISRIDVGRFSITAEGLAALGPFEPLESSPEKLRVFWIDKVGPSCGKILKAICDVYPNTITKPEIAVQTGYSEKSSGLDKFISELSSSHLIDRVGVGEFKASKELFPE
jgi:hypothetical protein